MDSVATGQTVAERGDGAQPEEPRRGGFASAISNSVVRLFADYTGRGPTKARTVLAPHLITVVLEDTLTKGERRLVAEGLSAHVAETRRAFQDAMREDLIATVEALSGRKVLALLSDHQVEHDIAAETFVLERSPEPVPGVAARAEQANGHAELS